jgi:A/G-specific adenine glycosylase
MAARDPVKGSIARLLAAWYRQGHRDLPWRETSDPYRIWVSEIMLQQTRVQTAIPYYQRFLERFPTVAALAAADEDAVLALWSGLGYYSRARNLHEAAREIQARGGFPTSYSELRKLAGIGDYTAAAIASMAFGEPRAAVDGNVLRVVARVANDASDTGSAKVREKFRAIAQAWMDRQDPAGFNQAMMELGATICLPRNPLCQACPVSVRCRARQMGTAAGLPVKLRRHAAVHMDAVLLLVEDGGRVLLRRREAGARRMAGFWDLPAPENCAHLRPGRTIGEFRHTITHHRIRFTLRAARTGPAFAAVPPFRWIKPREMGRIPLSTTARKALRLAGIL